MTGHLDQVIGIDYSGACEIDKTLLEHDSALCDVYRTLLLLLEPPDNSPKRRIGFHPDDK